MDKDSFSITEAIFMSVITGNQAREARIAMAMSQAEVSKEAGISRSFLSQFENQKIDLGVQTRNKLKDFYEKKGYEFEPLSDEPFDPSSKISEHQNVVQDAIDDLDEMEDGVIVDSFDLGAVLNAQMEMAKAMTQGFIADNGDFVLFRGHLVMKGLLKDRKDQVEDLISELNEDLSRLSNVFKQDLEGEIKSGFAIDHEPTISALVFAAFSKMMGLRGVCILGHCSLIKSVAGEPVAGGEVQRAALRHAKKAQHVADRLGFQAA